MKNPPSRREALSRRDFTRLSTAALGSLVLAGKSIGEQQSEPLANSTGGEHSYGTLPWDAGQSKHVIQYIRASAPEFDIPPLRGQHYVDTVPDTLDIAERAKLGIHVLTSITDPTADDEIYWVADFARNPPIMGHDFNDWVQYCTGFLEALPLLRTATGSTQNDHVDSVWTEALLRSIGPDGLVYLPFEGRPWSRARAPMQYLLPIWTPYGKSTRLSDPSIQQLSTAVSCERIISTMTVFYLRDQNPMWRETIEKMIRRLATFAVSKDDYAYMPAGSVEPGVAYGFAPMPTGFMAEETSAQLIQGLGQYFRATGFEPARDLGEKLTRYMRFHAEYYEPDGKLLVGDDERAFRFYSLWAANDAVRHARYGGHGHAHGGGLLSVLEYGAAVNDPETLAFVRGGYEWIKANSSPLVGWFPEFFIPGYDRCESCVIADMVGMSLKLTLAGAGDYWDDADRWARNHFFESQLIDPSWIHRLAERSPAKPVAPNETGDRVPERSMGAFAGWSTGNDWVVPAPHHPESIQHCCTGNSTRSTYYLWENILHYKEKSLSVNLLLNRASQWCDVHSYIPYEGRVDLKIKGHSDHTRVRMPEWIEDHNQQASCTVNGHRKAVVWEGRYIALGHVSPGDTVTVRFPISERTTREVIGGVTYTLTLRGNTVITIDPPGNNGPLYERAYFREPVKWRKVNRFVPDQAISW